MIHELQHRFYVDTPKGEGIAYYMIDGGRDEDLYWVVFLEATGECWTFRNPEIRMHHNYTLGIRRKPGQTFPQSALPAGTVTAPNKGVLPVDNHILHLVH